MSLTDGAQSQPRDGNFETSELRNLAPSPNTGDSDTVLEARNVGVQFGGLVALSDVSLVIPYGKLVGLMGPNGAGKTTLFNVLSGFIRPNSGSVSLLGRDVTSASPQIRARMGLTRTFQLPDLFKSLTVAEHLSLGYRLHHKPKRLWTDLVTPRAWGKPDKAEVEQVEKILSLLGLEEMANVLADGLPTGLTRLVQVGLGLAASPRVLLLDEPAAGLDTNETRELSVALSRAVEQEGTSMLVIEHDLDFLLGITGFVYVLDAGRLIASGSPSEVAQDRQVQSAYFGTNG
ncbi:MAG: transporter related [Acidimicrobiaceae bacterium]|nr:transporter related [Acidimicrobiaceae bacterium]